MTWSGIPVWNEVGPVDLAPCGASVAPLSMESPTAHLVPEGML